MKNEAWILDRFLRCAAMWADHIVVADQGSDDGSVEIAQRHPKVTLVRNELDQYDEGTRQRLLIDAARRIDPAAVLVALDADEALSANWRDSGEWDRVLGAAPGTVVRMKWVNLRPGLQTCWLSDEDIPFGYVDDGRPHIGSVAHSRRLPASADSADLLLQAVRVLHYQYTDWERMASKQRWYQCWERVHMPEKRPIAIFRQYHQMYGVANRRLRPIDPKWLRGYEEAGIDMSSVEVVKPYRSDREVLEMIIDRGADELRKVAVWDVDWAQMASTVGADVRPESVADPRTRSERAIHRWLLRTQRHAANPVIRAVQKSLSVVGW